MAAALQPAAIPTYDLAAELRAILSAAASYLLNDAGFLRITGPDAARWLNGMVTNDIQSLQPGEGNYNFLLNAQGRILGDCTIYRDPAPEPPAFLLQTDKSQIETIQQHLDHFIIMDDVELQPAPSNLSCLLVLGPNAPSILRNRYRSFRGGDRDPLPPLRLAFDSDVAEQITTPSAGLVPQFQIWTVAASIGSLTQYAASAGATEVSSETLEALRILSGTPRYGVDIRNTDAAHDLPQETGQTRALHFTKGCYLGQEIVERIRSRGNVHRTFHGFELTGALPAPGAPLTAESFPRPVGEFTSVAVIPLPESAAAPARTIQLALGYVRREALADAQARALTLEYPGGIATPIAMPYPIP
jgi:folate-binding protein YgfZ